MTRCIPLWFVVHPCWMNNHMGFINKRCRHAGGVNEKLHLMKPWLVSMQLACDESTAQECSCLQIVIRYPLTVFHCRCIWNKGNDAMPVASWMASFPSTTWTIVQANKSMSRYSHVYLTTFHCRHIYRWKAPTLGHRQRGFSDAGSDGFTHHSVSVSQWNCPQMSQGIEA